MAGTVVAAAICGCASTPGRDEPLHPVMAAVFCGERTLAVSTNYSDVALFDVSPLRFRSLLTKDADTQRPGGYSGIMRSPPIACSPDGKLLVAAGIAGAIVGWDVEARTERFRVPVDGASVGLTFFPDAKTFVTVGPGAKRWDAATGYVVGEFKVPGQAKATAVDVAPDGAVVLVGLSNGQISEFEASSGKLLRTLTGHSMPVTGIAFAPNGATFASTAGRFDPRIWNGSDSTPSPRRFTEIGGISESLAKSESDTQAAMLFVWLLGTARGFQIVGAPTMGAAPILSPALERAANESSELCDPAIAYSADGRFVATIAHLSMLSGELHLLLADMLRGEGHVISGIYGCGVSFSPDNKFLVTGGLGAPQVWNTETGTAVATPKSGS